MSILVDQYVSEGDDSLILANASDQHFVDSCQLAQASYTGTLVSSTDWRKYWYLGFPDGRVDHQIDRTSEKLLQGFQQTKVGVGICACWQWLELNHKVEVAFLSMVPAGRRRAEQVEPRDMVTEAELLQLGVPFFDD